MTKLKICGLSRPCDVDFVNAAMADYAGFVVNFPKSRRSVDADTVRNLAPRLAEGVVPVGVFVDEKPELVAELVNSGVIAAAQLHGSEDEAYMKRLRALCGCILIQAFRVKDAGDVRRAAQSSAEYVLLDGGQGGGKPFDWSLVKNFPRPFFVAGGLDANNVKEVIEELSPFAVDISSGAETDGYKDKDKITAAAAAVRRLL